jgi:hypothetical protein
VNGEAIIDFAYNHIDLLVFLLSLSNWQKRIVRIWRVSIIKKHIKIDVFTVLSVTLSVSGNPCQMHPAWVPPACLHEQPLSMHPAHARPSSLEL